MQRFDITVTVRMAKPQVHSRLVELFQWKKLA